MTEFSEEEKKERKRKSNNRIFGLLIAICVILLAGLVYEIITLVN